MIIEQKKKGGRPPQLYIDGFKTCTKCFVKKPLSDYYKSPTTKAKIQSCCKDCGRAYAKKNNERYRQNYKKRYENDEQYRKSLSEYFQKNKEKIRENRRKDYTDFEKSLSRRIANYKRRRIEINTCDGSINKASLLELLEKQSWKCAISNEPLEKGFHLDHIIPLSKGGLHTISNVQYVNARQNLIKGAKSLTPKKENTDGG